MNLKKLFQKNCDTKPTGICENKNTDKETIELGEGMHIEYELTRNGMGGYHPVNLELCNSSTGERYPILNRQGYFFHFPGVKSGKWQEKLSGPGFLEATDFICKIGRFQGGKAFFMWEVQPDGRYWQDEDGFGMTSDEEVWLYSWLDKKGRFIEPFSDERPEGLWGTIL